MPSNDISSALRMEYAPGCAGSLRIRCEKDLADGADGVYMHAWPMCMPYMHVRYACSICMFYTHSLHACRPRGSAASMVHALTRRWEKSSAEAGLMQASAAATAAAMTECMQLTRPGIQEHQLAAVFGEP